MLELYEKMSEVERRGLHLNDCNFNLERDTLDHFLELQKDDMSLVSRKGPAWRATQRQQTQPAAPGTQGRITSQREQHKTTQQIFFRRHTQPTRKLGGKVFKVRRKY